MAVGAFTRGSCCALALGVGLVSSACSLEARRFDSNEAPLTPDEEGAEGGTSGRGGAEGAAGGRAGAAGVDGAGAGGVGSPGLGAGAGATGAGVPGGGLPSIPLDSVIAAARADLEGVAAGERQFMRYVTLSQRSSASAGELAELRLALAKALNALSSEPELSPPVAVASPDLGEEPVLYRVDRRAYGWTRAVRLGGTDLSDGWEAIASATPYALSYVGEDADALGELADTSVPLLFADALIVTALTGDLYYGLLAVPGSAAELMRALGVDAAESRQGGELVRIGTFVPHIAGTNEHVAERYAAPAAREGGMLWLSYALGAADVFGSVFVSPLDFSGTPRLALFALPNGLPAFAAFDASGATIVDSNVALGPDAPASAAPTPAASVCIGCHARGPERMQDEVRSFSAVLGVPLPDGFDAVFLEQGALDALFAADRAAFAEASAALGAPADAASDPLALVLSRFERPLTLAAAAGELGVTPERLLEALPALDARLSPLGEGGTVTRGDFGQVFLPSACALLAAADNRPSPSLCE